MSIPIQPSLAFNLKVTFFTCIIRSYIRKKTFERKGFQTLFLFRMNLTEGPPAVTNTAKVTET